MRTLVSVSAAALVLATASFTGGTWWARRGATVSAHLAQTYSCPMHPQYRSDHPGDCPSCGMQLEPVSAAPPAGVGRAIVPGTVQVSVERQQAVGIKLGIAQRVSGTRMLRTTGRVAPDENATYPLVAGVSGWIRDVKSATTGSAVKKHEVLASFYAPEFVNAQQSYYTGLETVDRVATQQLQSYNQGRVIEGVQRFADTLRNMGVSDAQLAAMAKRREMVQDIQIASPVDGFVLQRGVSAGLRFDRGFELYRIADLSRVWILADLYQHQLRFIRRGAVARITTAQENRPLTATVGAAEPTFDEATLTLKVRLEAANPGSVLKPGMFVDVEIPIDVPPVVVVPADAIVDSGLRKIVFVDRGNGYFEPRQVETGWRIGGEVEITRGLMTGEQIVISGTFLIDSESRMRTATHRAAREPAQDPVCGMRVDDLAAAAAGRTVDHDGSAFFFCSDECKRRFIQEPGRYLTRRTDTP
jgi:membrane fusion protein, copper/silver efflux system